MRGVVGLGMLVLLVGPWGCDEGSAEDPDTGVQQPDQSVVDATAGPDKSVEAGVDAAVPDQSSGDGGACKKIANGVTLKTSTPIATILANQTQYNGKVVRVEGKIVEICQSQGCYVKLDDGKGNKINLKVNDGTLDFRKIAKVGDYAIGEGVVGVGSHGPQVFIEKHGALIGNCPAP